MCPPQTTARACSRRLELQSTARPKSGRIADQIVRLLTAEGSRLQKLCKLSKPLDATKHSLQAAVGGSGCELGLKREMLPAKRGSGEEHAISHSASASPESPESPESSQVTTRPTRSCRLASILSKFHPILSSWFAPPSPLSPWRSPRRLSLARSPSGTSPPRPRPAPFMATSVATQIWLITRGCSRTSRTPTVP